MEIEIQGIGPVGGFGAGVLDFEALLQGEQNMFPKIDQTINPKTNRKIDPKIELIKKNDTILELPCFRADIKHLEKFIPKKKLRRIDRFSTLALLGACLAIQDAGFALGTIQKDQLQNTESRNTEPLDSTAILVATGYGASATTFSFLDSFLDKGDSLSMPTHFSNSVHNAAAAHISILLGIKGPCLTVSQFDLSFCSALFTAMCWLREKRVKRVLVGGIDEYTDVLGYATAGFEGKKTARLNIAGEGGCFFLLAQKGSGNSSSNSSSYGTIENVDMVDPLKIQILSPGHQVMHPDIHRVIMGARGYGACKENGLDSSGNFCHLHGYSPVSYGHLYGHFPAAAALDLGVACIGLKEHNLEMIHCLKPGNDHLWGRICLKSHKTSKKKTP